MLYTQIFPLEKEKDIERYSSLNIFCAFFSFELIRLAAAADIFARVGIVLHSSFPARKKEERLTAFFFGFDLIRLVEAWVAAPRRWIARQV